MYKPRMFYHLIVLGIVESAYLLNQSTNMQKGRLKKKDAEGIDSRKIDGALRWCNEYCF